MKNIKQLVLTVLLTLVNITAQAYDFEVDGFYYNTISLQDLTCEITYGDKEYSGDIVIPSTVNYNGKTFTVTKIGKNSFNYSTTSLTIPNSIKEIGDYALQDCCITNLTIPNSVIIIGEGAFKNCKHLKSVSIPNSVTEIKKNTFQYCDSLVSITIPNSVTIIGEGSFQSCDHLKSVSIPNSVTSIGKYAFHCCFDLTSVSIPTSVTEISYWAFCCCYSLTSVIIPNSVIDIKEAAFAECLSLSSVLIGNSVINIGREAFADCPILSSVTLGESVTRIGDYAFSNCSALMQIISKNSTPPTIYENSFRNVSKTDCIIKVPEKSVVAYKAAEKWSAFWNIESINSEVGEEKFCETPKISLVDGNIVATSATEGSKCYTSITTEDFKNYDGNDPIALSGIYKISSYAHAEGYQNSETVTATLIWVNPTINGGTDVLNMAAKKAVVIAASANGLRISGTESGEMISVHSLDGGLIKNVVAEDEMTEIDCPNGFVIVKIGDKTVKVNVK